jgi:hypothetical protein
VLFGLLVIIWLIGLGITLLREHPARVVDAPTASLVEAAR